MMTGALLTITAAIEAGAGIALAIAPSTATLALLGSRLDSPVGLVLARVLGAALFAIGVACWIARDEAPGRAASGLIAALMVYNVAVVAIMIHSLIGPGLWGFALPPAVLLHSALAAWCGAALRSPRTAGRS